jgi:hypothetical protein
MMENGRLVGGKGWKERVYSREEWKKLLKTTRKHSAHANGMNVNLLLIPVAMHCKV